MNPSPTHMTSEPTTKETARDLQRIRASLERLRAELDAEAQRWKADSAPNIRAARDVTSRASISRRAR